MEASAEIEKREKSAEIMEVKDRLKRLNEHFRHFGLQIPPRESWTPAEEAFYKPTDLYRVPVDEAQEMQLKAIKYTFTHHYTLNDFYHRYCEARGVTPDDIKTNDDLEKIPLIPDTTFKTHPSGKDLAYWIVGIFTGDLPEIAIKGVDPTFDDIINAFNAAGLAVGYTSGTSGRPSVVPRDTKGFLTAQYLMEKLKIGMWDDDPDHSLSLFPRPTNTNLMAAKAWNIQSRLYRDHHFALDFEITADQVEKAMQGKDRYSTAPQSAHEVTQRILESGFNWIERYEKTADTVYLIGVPGLFLALMNALEGQGKHYEFGERGTVLTAGGWKTQEDNRISPESFRKRVEETLGIPETRCFDLYGISEVGALGYTCPEGYYYHLPYTWFKPLVLDRSLKPAGYGERGRFAFLNAAEWTYPCFFITGDEGTMLEHCPVCDRPGPVLEPGIQRAKGEEVRGCANVVQRVLEQDLKDVKGG